MIEKIEAISDLHYIGRYAEELKTQILCQEKPDTALIRRMAQLAIQFARKMDKDFPRFAKQENLSCTD